MAGGAPGVVVITGANAGIGKEAAVRLARGGATVVMAARDPERGRLALDEVRRRAGADAGLVELVTLDLASFASIRAAAAEVLGRFDRLDALVNNAGAILSHRQLTAEGFEATFGVNHLGHFLLTALLRQRLEDSAPSRVVTTSSIAHRFAGGLSWASLAHRPHYDGWTAYTESKLANVVFTLELARRLEGTGVTATCCHPGIVRSHFSADRDTSGAFRALAVAARPTMVSPRRGATPIVRAAADPALAGCTGAYLVGGYLPGVHRHRPSAAARDPESGARLWELSERLVVEADAM